MVQIVRDHLPDLDSVIDVGCGGGQYGAALRATVGEVYGIDHDPTLCEAARTTRSYRHVVCAPVADVAEHFFEVDAVFCSELLEHIPADELPDVIDAIESVARRRVVITVPNPRSPHYRLDPTHIGDYSTRSMLRLLNRRGRFSYRLLPLGFADQSLSDMRWTRVLQPIARRVAALSPTVLYVGESENAHPPD